MPELHLTIFELDQGNCYSRDVPNEVTQRAIMYAGMNRSNLCWLEHCAATSVRNIATSVKQVGNKNDINMLTRRFNIAPMMDWTD
jgi:hypothetical protein